MVRSVAAQVKAMVRSVAAQVKKGSMVQEVVWYFSGGSPLSGSISLGFPRPWPLFSGSDRRALVGITWRELSYSLMDNLAAHSGSPFSASPFSGSPLSGISVGPESRV